MLARSFLLFLLLKTAISDSSDIGLHTPDIIENHGYVAETHEVVTSDGYILSVHRIPYGIGENDTSNRPVAFLMHGLISSSSDYVNMGPNASLAFILADAGYDVWLGNARGNAYSRNHTTLDPVTDAAQFFDFSWHEIGYNDLASSIDYILEVTSQESLYYVGHSQGCTTFLVLASSRPEYNAKIKLASLMAPAAILTHRPFGWSTEFVKYIELVEKILKNWEIYELPYADAIRQYAVDHCSDPAYHELCEILFTQLAGNLDPNLIDFEMIPVIATNAPSNCAMKQFVHFGQLVKYGGFTWYNYGEEGNLARYGSETPPPYNLSAISAPVAIYYSKDDTAVPFVDVQDLITQIPNLANKYVVPYDGYGHANFVFGKANKELVYNELMSVLQKY